MTGQSLVGPEGMMELGPYGAVKVVGLNPDQARTAVERQLSRYLKNPKVTLSLDAPGQRNSNELKAKYDESPGGKEHSSLITHDSSLATVGWQRAQMGDEIPPPAEAPTIEIPAPTTPISTPKKESSEKPAADQKSQVIGKDDGPSLLNSSSVSSREAPAEFPLNTTERVSQWRPMVRRDETSSVALVPQGWETNPKTSVKNVMARPTSGVINAAAQEKDSQLPLPRQLMPKAADSPKVETLPGPPPREVIEGHGPQGVYTPRSDMGAPVPREGAKVSLPPYVIEPPDILLIESTQGLKDQPIRGQHLVRPDGTVSLGIYGSAYVAGMTLDQAKESIGRTFATRIQNFSMLNLSVDVLAYNSKFYYVITDGAGYGEQVIRMPIMGSETVLDGISQIYGLPAVASKKRIWVARRSADGTTDQVLPVDWCGISQRGSEATNYQIMPGDRIYVDAKKWVRFDTGMARFLSPFERVLGITLLGSETVNSISGRTTGTGGGL